MIPAFCLTRLNYLYNTMACNKPEHLRCPKCKEKKEDQSTGAFREFVEANPSRPESKIYDV